MYVTFSRKSEFDKTKAQILGVKLGQEKKKVKELEQELKQISTPDTLLASKSFFLKAPKTPGYKHKRKIIF